MTIAVLLVIAGIATAAGLRAWWNAREREAEAHSPPPLFYPLPPSLPQTHVNGNGASRPADVAVFRPIAVEPSRMVAEPPRVNVEPPRGTVERPRISLEAPRMAVEPSRMVVEPPRMAAESPRMAAESSGMAVEAPRVEPPRVEPQRFADRMPFAPLHDEHDSTETVRFVRPSELSVQLLPGRLEVLEGTTAHREIRFLRVPGEPAQVILGREPGLTPHYVGLGSPTVSRRHARFDFTNDRWIVKNLSRTNPLVVNDDELFDTDVARPLVDGDRLELGDVVLRFHAH